MTDDEPKRDDAEAEQLQAEGSAEADALKADSSEVGGPEAEKAVSSDEPDAPEPPPEPEAADAPEAKPEPGTDGPAPDPTRERRRSGRGLLGGASAGRSARPDRDPASRRETGASPRSRNVWLAAIAVVVIGCALLTCGALAGTGIFGSPQARTKTALQDADAHWQRATTAMALAAASLAQVKPASGPAATAAVAKAAADASASIRQAQVELEGAHTALGQMPDGPVKTPYLDAIAEAQAAVKGLDVMLVSLGQENHIYGIAAAGAQQVQTGTTHLAAAIGAVNGNDYAAAMRETSLATRAFDAATPVFEAGRKADPKGGFDEALTYVAKLRAEAGLVHTLAGAGAAKNVKTFNALAAKQAAMQRSIASLKQPAIVTDRAAAVGRVDAQRKTIRTHLERAQKLYDQARAAYKAQSTAK